MSRKSTTETSSANLGFEQNLWLAADKLRNNMDAAGCISDSGKRVKTAVSRDFRNTAEDGTP